MSFSPNKLSPINNIECSGQVLAYHQDRFVPDVQATAGEQSPTQSYYPAAAAGRKRTREDSGIWAEDFEEGFLGGSLLTGSDSKRHCSPVNSVFPDSPLSLDHTGISIPVTSTGGSSPINQQQGVDFFQQASSASSCSAATSQQYSFQPSFPALGGNIGGALFGTTMQQCDSVIAGQSTFSEEYQLIITEQPELYYRARYQTEGVRAPIKGRKDNYPSVQVIGPAQFNYGGKVVVKLVHEDGTDHTSCSLDCSEERKNALVKKIGPHTRMATEFEDLRIRREKKKDGRKMAATDKLSQKEGHNDKVACLLFEAEIRTPDQGVIKCKVKSDPISLNAAPEPAELDWIQPERGHVIGRETVVIKGSKMTSPKVTFRVYLDGGKTVDLHGTVDKDRSHQNVLLVRTPSLAQHQAHFGTQNIPAEVIVTTGRTQLASNRLRFEFIPDHICRECMQDTSSLQPQQQQYPTGASCSSPMPIGLYPPSTLQHTHEHPSPTHVPQSPAQEPAAYKVTAGPTVTLPQGSLSNPGDIMPSQSTGLISQTFLDGSGSSEKQDESIMQFVQTLIGNTDYPGDAPSTSATNTQQQQQQQNLSSSSYMLPSASPYVSVESQLQTPPPSYQLPSEGAINSPPYLGDNPISSPNVDTPLYSPVTPIPDSPAPGVWIRIEQMLLTLQQTGQILPDEYMLYKSHCTSRNLSLYNAYVTSQNNEQMFLQLLACSVKSDIYPKMQ